MLKIQPRNTQLRRFLSLIQVFSFSHKILQLDKFEGSDFKYDNIISKRQQILKSGIFGPKFNGFAFAPNLVSRQIQIPAQEYQNKAFLVPSLAIFALFLWKILQLDKFEGVD